MMDFLVELFAFLCSRWKLWVRPIVACVLIIGCLLMLANGFLERLFSHRAYNTPVPFSHGHYRHDAASFNRY